VQALPYLPFLSSLNVTSCCIVSAGFVALVHALKVHSSKHVCFDRRVHSNCVCACARIQASSTKLVELIADGNDVGDAGATGLVKSGLLSSLTALSMKCTTLRAQGAKVLADAIQVGSNTNRLICHAMFSWFKFVSLHA
jgi:hypothetical protein